MHRIATFNFCFTDKRYRFDNFSLSLVISCHNDNSQTCDFILLSKMINMEEKITTVAYIQ